MSKRNWISGVVVACALVTVPVGGQAQSGQKSGAASSVTAANSSSAARVSPELLTSTVHEAWLASGRNEDKFFDMVKQCAEMSAQKRGVSLPNTEAAGREMGNDIKEYARKDPDQLLYAVVDQAVRETAKEKAGAKKTSAKQ